MQLPIERVNVSALKKAMTIKYMPMGADEPLKLTDYKEDGTYLVVPRQFGLEYCRREGIEYVDGSSFGCSVKFPKVPAARDYQVETLKLISNSLDSYFDFIFRARTGWGKTAGALIAAADRGVSTIILVDQENLKDQWIATLVDLFGFAKNDVGIIQGKVCTYEGKAVTIAMVQTLSQKQYTQEVYDYFGMVIVDEVHIIGAPTFSTVLFNFPAMYRFGVSATPKRRDGLQKVLEHHLGRVRVYVDDKHDKSSVYIAEHDSVYSWYANTSPKIGRFITEVSDDGARNLLVAEAVIHLYDTGRDVLVLSDRIEQLQHLKSLCYYSGISETEMGLYAGYTPTYMYAKDPTPLRRPEGYVRGLQYTPISLQLVSKRNNKRSLEHVKENAKIIFSTYGMFSKGVDEPRLSGGVDATPRSQAEQVHGRILRVEDNKPMPIWITIADTSSYRSLHSLHGRIAGYIKNNAELHTWAPNEDSILCHENTLKAEMLAAIHRLKSMQIQACADGSGHELVTKEQEIRRSFSRVSGSRAGIRSATSARKAV